ncbi:7452_t:CDS:2, partial [Dentiscutata heterogama]
SRIKERNEQLEAALVSNSKLLREVKRLHDDNEKINEPMSNKFPPKKKKQQLKNSEIAAPGGSWGRGYSGVVASSNTAISRYANYTNAKTVETLANNQKEMVEALTT